jgi:hypothetical protein
MAGIPILALDRRQQKSNAVSIVELPTVATCPRNGEIRHRICAYYTRASLSALQYFIRKHGSMMRLRGTLGCRRRRHMQFSSHKYARPQGGIISRSPVLQCHPGITSCTSAGSPRKVEFGDCWHVQVLFCTYLSRPRKSTWQGVHVSNEGSNLVSVIQRQGKQWSVPCDS